MPIVPIVVLDLAAEYIGSATASLESLLSDEMGNIWPKEVILSIAVRREQSGRDKSTQARLDSDRLCGTFSNCVELALKECFLFFVRQVMSFVF